MRALVWVAVRWLVEPDRLVLVFIAALPLLCASAALYDRSDYQHEPDRTNQTTRSKAGDSFGGSGRIISVVAPLQTDVSQPDTKRTEQRAEEELQAQQEMARWAFPLLFVTSIGVTATIAGVFYVKYTLDLNRELLIQTQNGVKAALEANKIAEEMAHKQFRAYLSVTNVSVKINQNVLREKHLEQVLPPSCDVLIKYGNTGQTPARNVRIRYTLRWIADFGKLDRSVELPADVKFYKYVNESDIQAGDREREYAKREDRLFRSDEIEQEKTSSWYIYGDIIYSDIFYRRYRLFFRYWYRPYEHLANKRDGTFPSGDVSLSRDDWGNHEKRMEEA